MVQVLKQFVLKIKVREERGTKTATEYYRADKMLPGSRHEAMKELLRVPVKKEEVRYAED